ACDPVGLYLGTTGGELWSSPDEGRSWRPITSHLPEILSVVATTP
ncbi:MAG TPA: glycosyl hydrolase, partial [Planctomycetota bacterium]|nr:glycosyl hydrolase [Planctomycetota bacterium]